MSSLLMGCASIRPRRAHWATLPRLAARGLSMATAFQRLPATCQVWPGGLPGGVAARCFYLIFLGARCDSSLARGRLALLLVYPSLAPAPECLLSQGSACSDPTAPLLVSRARNFLAASAPHR